MKSKSPLNAYKYNMTGAYANPQTVIQPILGAEVAKSVIGAASKLGSQLITKEVGGKAAKQAKASKNFSDMAKSGQEESNKIQNSKVGGESILETDLSSKGMMGAVKPELGNFSFLSGNENPLTQMKGSPVKHNAGAAGAIGSDFSQAKNQYADIFGKSATTVGQNKQSGVGALQSFITRAKNQGGSMVGSVGQQIGNQAQQIAADAGGSTGVDPFLPPPNQVAETGSYGGGGDRILEMDSNPVGNQSIGRNTDVTSQLFGSGQRASMLAMKGTPLAHKTAAKHPEPHRKTKTFGGKLKPGDPYIVADNVDEGGSNPPDTLNLKKYKQPNYMSNPGDQYKKDQFPDEDIFYQNNDQLNKEGFNTDSTSSVRIFKN